MGKVERGKRMKQSATEIAETIRQLENERAEYILQGAEHLAGLGSRSPQVAFREAELLMSGTIEGSTDKARAANFELAKSQNQPLIISVIAQRKAAYDVAILDVKIDYQKRMFRAVMGETWKDE